MKKIFCLAVVFLAASAVNSFAAQAVGAGGTLSAATPVVMQMAQFSKNVYCNIESNATQFAAITVHLNGDKEYGTSSTDTKIYVHTVTVGQTAATVLTASDTSQMTGWSKL